MNYNECDELIPQHIAKSINLLSAAGYFPLKLSNQHQDNFPAQHYFVIDVIPRRQKYLAKYE